MNQQSTWEQVKYRVFALLLIAGLLIAFVVAAMAYDRDFERAIPVTLRATRAGLQMHPNNRVKVAGVDLGFVHSVKLNGAGGGVDIVLYLDPHRAAHVPANADVRLDQLTAFGNKTVQLTYPTHPSSEKLHAGSVIQANHVTTEINSTFDNLMTLLTEVKPAKLNATLGALAQALNGKGRSLGTTLTTADQYLTKLNANVPAMRRDFRSAAGFSRLYADVAPNLVDLLRNAATTTSTLSDPKVRFPGLLHSLHGAGANLEGFFDVNGDRLTGMLISLRPFTSLLQQYSPGLTCYLNGEAHAYRQYEKNTIINAGGASVDIGFSPQVQPYGPQDMPTVGPGVLAGPRCYGLPNPGPSDWGRLDNTSGPDRLNDTRRNGYQAPNEPAVVALFGKDALPLGAHVNQLPIPAKGGGQ